MDSMSFNGQWPGTQSKQRLMRAVCHRKAGLCFCTGFPVVFLLEFFQEARFFLIYPPLRK